MIASRGVFPVRVPGAAQHERSEWCAADPVPPQTPTASLRAADTLASACPAERALTAPGRMAAMRARLAAVKAATAAIRPALTRFYDALDEGQRGRFAGMS